jgi:endonuclease YncB( thermonuclease family)
VDLRAGAFHCRLGDIIVSVEVSAIGRLPVRQCCASVAHDGIDLADWLVRNGPALDRPQYARASTMGAQRDVEHAVGMGRQLR